MNRCSQSAAARRSSRSRAAVVGSPALLSVHRKRFLSRRAVSGRLSNARTLPAVSRLLAAVGHDSLLSMLNVLNSSILVSVTDSSASFTWSLGWRLSVAGGWSFQTRKMMEK
ncbi:myb-like HTH transcriptional regulator family protein [Striga asiatica]|uniref:Myb-like HTH transcriptional regulator family protein n=1 Tax=Striga asiatica TaxID=4170 RepID=A0A5A7PIR3_STRAF|nr:myb-like HTH transcriptional regulator family protein [Striga asiatica]